MNNERSIDSYLMGISKDISALSTKQYQNLRAVTIYQILKNKTSSEKLLENIASLGGVLPEQLIEEKKFYHIFALNMVLHKIYRNLGFSYPKIGGRLNKDHTTILHSVSYFDEEIKNNEYLAKKALEIEPSWVDYNFIEKQKVDNYNLKDIIKVRNSITTNSRLNIDTVLPMISISTGIKIADIKSENKRREIANTRKVASYLYREKLRLSFPAIAYQLNKKDHTTAYYAYQEAIECLKKN
jgi:chromosomal replication initiation ATPase DnaA